jgi:hypothetical protein
MNGDVLSVLKVNYYLQALEALHSEYFLDIRAAEVVRIANAVRSGAWEARMRPHNN